MAKVDKILKDLNKNYVAFEDLRDEYEDNFAEDLDSNGAVMRLWNEVTEDLRSLKNRLTEFSNGDAEPDEFVYNLWQKARKSIDRLDSEFIETMVGDAEMESFKDDFDVELDFFYEIGDDIYEHFVED